MGSYIRLIVDFTFSDKRLRKDNVRMKTIKPMINTDK